MTARREPLIPAFIVEKEEKKMSKTDVLCERLTEVINEMYPHEVVPLWNDFCEENFREDDRIYYMEDINDWFHGCSVVKIIEDTKDIEPSDDYFHESAYGIESFDDPFDVIDLMILRITSQRMKIHSATAIFRTALMSSMKNLRMLRWTLPPISIIRKKRRHKLGSSSMTRGSLLSIMNSLLKV